MEHIGPGPFPNKLSSPYFNPVTILVRVAAVSFYSLTTKCLRKNWQGACVRKDPWSFEGPHFADGGRANTKRKFLRSAFASLQFRDLLIRLLPSTSRLLTLSGHWALFCLLPWTGLSLKRERRLNFLSLSQSLVWVMSGDQTHRFSQPPSKARPPPVSLPLSIFLYKIPQSG